MSLHTNINVILQWVWNVNDINTLIPLLTLFDGKMKLLRSLYIATTNSILIIGYNLKVEVYLEGLVKPNKSDKKLAEED